MLLVGAQRGGKRWWCDTARVAESLSAMFHCSMLDNIRAGGEEEGRMVESGWKRRREDLEEEKVELGPEVSEGEKYD